jgi:hypothetical protein
MLERSQLMLKVTCLALALVLVFQLGRLVVRSNPLAHVTFPALPSLPPETNAPAGGSATNSPAGPGGAKAVTNMAHPEIKATSAATNSALAGESGKAATNAPPAEMAKAGTNSATAPAAKASTNSAAEPRAGTTETNTVVRSPLASTNPGASPTQGSSSHSPKAVAGPPPGMPGMNPFGPHAVPKAPELPLPILARVDRITDSEILGPVMRPLPMALLGIAGNVAFLRAANGQTGLVKEGDSLGALKLIRIGINRVLVEEDGQQKELMIFSGYGGESLLPKPMEKSK